MLSEIFTGFIILWWTPRSWDQFQHWPTLSLRPLHLLLPIYAISDDSGTDSTVAHLAFFTFLDFSVSCSTLFSTRTPAVENLRCGWGCSDGTLSLASPCTNISRNDTISRRMQSRRSIMSVLGVGVEAFWEIGGLEIGVGGGKCGAGGSEEESLMRRRLAIILSRMFAWLPIWGAIDPVVLSFALLRLWLGNRV